MQTARAVIRFVAELLLVLGAVACILVWLEIKPKDLMISWGHLLWLLFGIFLLLSSIGSSGYSLYLQLRKPERAAEVKRFQPPQWSPSEERQAVQAEYDFRNLPFNQKIALVILYRKPSVPISQFQQTLEMLGFSKPQEDITNPLLAGNLVYKDSEGRIHLSSHRPIYLTIEQEIEKGSRWL